MPQSRERQLILFGVATLLGGIVLLWTLYLIKGVLLVLYVSGLLAIGLSPIVALFERELRQLTRHTAPRWVAIFVLYVCTFLVVGLTVAIVVPPFVQQARGLWLDLPKYVDMAQDALQRAGVLSGRWTSAEILDRLPNPGVAVAGVVGVLRTAAGAAATIITVIVLPYYMLLESEAMHRTFITLFAPGQRLQVSRLIENVTLKIGAWLGGQLVLAAIIGTSAAVGLWLLGVPYFYVFAVLAAIGEMIPVVGPIVAAVPAVLVSFSVSIHTGVFVAIYFTAQQFLENHFIVPRVMQKQVGVSAVTVIVALLIGSELLGIVGALLAVPSAAIVQVMVEEYLGRD
jgi:predicted PurR-regulated permease PerM